MNCASAVAPSIGLIGSLFEDELNNRIKCFLKQIFPDEQTAYEHVCGLLEDQYPGIWSGDSLLSRNLRVSVRVCVAEESNTICKPCASPQKLHVDATLKVGVKGIGSIVYFGANGVDRQPTEYEIKQERKHLSKMHHRYPQVETPVMPVIPPRGVYLDRLQNASPQDIDDLLDMYRSCFSVYLVDFDPDVIIGSIESNLYMVARNDQGQIIASAVGEVAEVGDLRIMEISEIAAYPDRRISGAATACTRAVAAMAREDGVDVIFSEARTNWDAIICVEYVAGLVARGYMPRHCRINSSFSSFPQANDFCNLHVMQLL